MHRHERDRLRDVQRRAAAEPDDRIGVVRLEGLHAIGDLLLGGIAVDPGIDLHREPVEPRAEVLQDRQRCQPLVGDDQRALHALLAQVLGHQAPRAGTEVDGGREGEFADH